jgi:hypothetical protein
MVGARKSFVTVAGKGARLGLIELGRWRWALAAGSFCFSCSQ